MSWTCHACGARFYSMGAEARHRHNFPAMCTRNKRFERWSKETNIEAMQAKLEPLPRGSVFVVFWSAELRSGNVVSAIYRKVCEGPDIECILDCEGVRPEPKLATTIGRTFLENKLRVEVLPADKLDTFDMLWMHGLDAKASRLAGGPEVQRS